MQAAAETPLAVIERFLREARQPALMEPGDEIMPLEPEGYAVEMRGSRLTLQAWDRTRNLVRRVVAVTAESRGRVELTVERFARKEGKLFLLDLARPAGSELGKRSGWLVFRERFRLFLRRQFPEWTLAEISAETDLQHSLSPAYPRAFLRHGQRGWAAIGSPVEADASAALTFGLIWLSHLREREPRVTVEGLAVYVRAGEEHAVSLRMLCLDPNAAQFALFSYSADDLVTRADPSDFGNLDTRLETCRRPAPQDAPSWRGIAQLPGVEAVPRHDGRTSLRIRGLEFAEADGDGLSFGIGERRPARESHAAEIERLVEELDRARSPHAADRQHPLWRQFPEAWLESVVRSNVEQIDVRLLASPVYGQVPAFAGGDRGVIDLLACGRDGRLAVVEVKASADIHLPLQSLDYWVRVKWHLERGEFTPRGYFPGVALRPEAPRLLLVAPSLEFHPSTETLLSYFSPAIEVVRIGVGVEWRKGLDVMFRLEGADRP